MGLCTIHMFYTAYCLYNLYRSDRGHIDKVNNYNFICLKFKPNHIPLKSSKYATSSF